MSRPGRGSRAVVGCTSTIQVGISAKASSVGQDGATWPSVAPPWATCLRQEEPQRPAGVQKCGTEKKSTSFAQICHPLCCNVKALQKLNYKKPQAKTAESRDGTFVNSGGGRGGGCPILWSNNVRTQ